ncbi:2-oxoisovalerate dehydrogenase subunit alpha, mitochondrial [Venturia canescens]|uniref:2-oxoisovalerate dehydrogenase subunit alpha, mitochondrial n=1 Tax=Venturia canescens TaxID=32260 RepID=UPI001C9D3AEA|nr:2-oxoisovalerate dehydrogenase subunit alpha, mitochondrial [Venturia canescens]
MAARRFLRIFNNPNVSKVKRLSSVAQDPQFLGLECRFTDKIHFINKQSYDPIPIYRILTPTNDAKTIANIVKVDKERLLQMYKSMVSVSVMDKILYESQRQGRISFYMTSVGEEALQIGSAEAVTLKDLIYSQYREAGVLLHRGYSFSEFMNQCYGNCEDRGKGRQMPVHFGSKELNFVTISSPLTTQLPQAVGAAYAIKRTGSDACVVCYFGDGAASEGDAHAAFNFAATLDCPIVFICRNNGYAISTPTVEQYRGDGIAARGPAYGINTLRVDGNDVLATLHATREARAFCIKEKKPVLIEAMTYRVGHHSTSDDSTAYRSSDEIAEWNNQSPISKFRRYLENLGYWNGTEETLLQKSIKSEVLSSFNEAELKLKPHWKELFTDVYQQIPQHIKNQMEAMESHLKEYGEHYPLKGYKEI